MSNVPPPFSPQEGYRKNNKNSLIILVIVAILVGGCLLAVAATAFFGFAAWGQISPMAGCQITYQAMEQSVQNYALEHNGKLPSADQWQDELRPYLKKALKKIDEDGSAKNIIKMMDPNSEKWGCYLGKDDKMSGIAINDAVAGKSVDSIESKSTTPILFEIEEPRVNAHEAYRKRDAKDSPAIFGEHRGWMVITWDGVYFEDEQGRRSTSSGRGVRIQSRSSRSQQSDSSSEDASE